MRKHFIILMLMALLPLAGWAAPLRTIEALSPYYGEVPTINVYGESNTPLTEGTHYTFEGFFSAKTCAESEKLTEAQVKATKVGTELWVKVSGKNGYEGTKVGSFVIKKMSLVILGNFVTNKDKKTYGGADPTGNIFTVSKVYTKVDEADGTYNTDMSATLGNIFSFARDNSGENSENAGKYDLICTITNATAAANYVVESANIYTTLPVFSTTSPISITTAGTQAQFEIKPKAFTLGSTNPDVAATIEITIDDSQLIYNGKNQKPVITVHDIALNKDLKLDTDYTVTYPTIGSGDNVQPNHKTAATHDITISGKGNYAENEIAKNFTIAPRPVLVWPVVKKYYDAKAELPAIPVDASNKVTAGVDLAEAGEDGVFVNKFVFQGLMPADLPTNIAVNKTNLSLATNGGLETTQVYATTSTVALKFAFAANMGINDVFTLANYTFIASDGTLEIEKRPVTAKADDATINYGAAENFDLIEDAATAVGGTDADEALVGSVYGDSKALRYIIKVTKAPAAETTGDKAGKYKLTPEFLGDQQIRDKVNAVKDVAILTALGTSYTDAKLADAKAKAIIALINLKNSYDMTPANGYLTYNKATLYIALKQSAFTLSKVYDGEKISLDDQLSKLSDVNNLVITGFQGKDNINTTGIFDLSKLTMTVNGNDAAASTYDVVLSGAKSDFYKFSYINSTYTITKRPILLSIPQQNFQTGVVPTIVQNYSIETIEGVDADEQRVADNEKVADVFKLGFAPMVYRFESYGPTSDGTHYANGTAKVVSVDATAGKTTIEVLTNEPEGNNISAEDAAAFVGKKFTVPSVNLMNESGNRLQLTEVGEDHESNLWVVTTLLSGEKVTVDAAGKIANAANREIANGIIAVDPETEGSVFANYEFSYTDGSCKVQILGTVRQLNDKSDLTELTATAAGTTESVTIDTDRQIKKNVWASLVLPFNTTVREVSKDLGYAVVDMFVEDPNSDAMNFKLHMGEIPAYTPFLVKTDETINLNAVVFKGVKVVKLDEDTEDHLTQSNKSYNFIGCMNFDEVGSDYWSDGSKMTEESILFNKYQPTRKQRALKAYITAKPGVSEAPIINIEEADGTITSINAVTAEKINAVKEGWYTLNGVKLNAAPAEKGIYINNGKKVVIK